jgi:hypothetical protein
VFVLRLRRGDKIEEASADTVLQEGDVLALAGAREVLVKLGESGAEEVDDPACSTCRSKASTCCSPTRTTTARRSPELPEGRVRARLSSWRASRVARRQRRSRCCRPRP